MRIVARSIGVFMGRLLWSRINAAEKFCCGTTSNILKPVSIFWNHADHD
jgi:hypothetical protein